MKISFTKYQLITISSALFLIVIWKILSVVVSSEIIIPSPEKTIITLISLATRPDFWSSVFFTLLRGLTGFALAFISALPLGILSALNPSLRAFLQPIVIILRSTPIVAFILLALIWLSPDRLPVFIAFLTMFPIIYTNVTEGVKNINPEFIDLAKIYRFSFYKKLTGIYIPSILPFIFSGISSALGFGWRATIIGEVLSQPLHGIGTQMQTAQIYLMVPNIIAWTVVAVLISFVFEKIIQLIERKTIIWKE
jgi:NitT/TauT family transport system permease protein